MAARKFNFLNNTEAQIKQDSVEEVKDTPIIDTKVIEYVINEFQSPAKDISKALLNLQITLEKSIDFIEDKSSEVIKTNRDFELSSKYRDTCIRLHEISISLKEYVNWMDVLSNKEPPIEKPKTEKINESVETKIDSGNYRHIYDDFTGVTPIKFTLDSFSINVDNWDDLLMETASLLTKNYKDNKLSKMIFPQHMPVIIKKSHENELRDTVIEMLSEYKINLTSFKVFIN